MKWKRASTDYVEDRRGAGGGGLGGGGMSIPLPGGMAGAGGGVGLIVIIIFIAIQLLSGGLGGGGGSSTDPGTFPGPNIQAPDDARSLPAEEEQVEFVKAVVEDVQETWKQAFAEAGQTYQTTTLVLFEDSIDTGCGFASAQSGPFYCPADRKVYLDLSFFRELSSRFGAPGDFAQAYVIAHEFGHHVQTILGINDQVRRAQDANPGDANALSVKLELQADCFAGVWAHTIWAEPGQGAVEEITDDDIREGLDAAAAVGDDRIQQQSGGGVNPESWTHGSSQQRMDWFNRGFKQGTTDACDTFAE